MFDERGTAFELKIVAQPEWTNPTPSLSFIDSRFPNKLQSFEIYTSHEQSKELIGVCFLSFVSYPPHVPCYPISNCICLCPLFTDQPSFLLSWPNLFHYIYMFLASHIANFVRCERLGCLNEHSTHSLILLSTDGRRVIHHVGWSEDSTDPYKLKKAGKTYIHIYDILACMPITVHSCKTYSGF